MTIENFGRREFYYTEKKIKELEDSATEQEQLGSELKERLAEKGAKEHPNLNDIINIAQQIHHIIAGTKGVRKEIDYAQTRRLRLIKNDEKDAYHENATRDEENVADEMGSEMGSGPIK